MKAIIDNVLIAFKYCSVKLIWLLFERNLLGVRLSSSHPQIGLILLPLIIPIFHWTSLPLSQQSHPHPQQDFYCRFNFQNETEV